MAKKTRVIHERKQLILHQILVNKTPHQTILDEIQLETGTSITRRHFLRILASWDVSSKVKTQVADGASPEDLIADISKCVYEHRLPDKDIQADLTSLGHSISLVGVARARKALGFTKRIARGDQAAEEARIRADLTREYDERVINNHGANMLYEILRHKYHHVGRNRVRSIAMQLNPSAFEKRRKRLQNHRGAVIVPGPNFAWSMDGHLKLKDYGFEVYAAIDVYSRKIMWTYIGITGRTQNSVFRQYVQTLRDTGIIPRILRTDCRTETPRMADTHLLLSRLVRPDENLSFQQCFHYGKSTNNQRIEAWWRPSTEKCLGDWTKLFDGMKRQGTLDMDKKADRITLLAIYMPIIKTNHAEWVETYNRHCIRKQPKRPWVKPGIPNRLYEQPELMGDSHQGFPIDASLLDGIDADLDGFDMDEYLPAVTLDFCNQSLARHDISLEHMNSRSYMADGSYVHCHAYLLLRDQLNEHIESGCEPRLIESSKPLKGPPPLEETMQVFYDANQPLVIDGEVYVNGG